MRIRWHLQRETRFPFGPSPDPDWFDPIGFPPPWPDRPWIYAVMVASANGVVTWRRSGPDDDPVRAILGDDDTRPERIADRRHMRHLRCYGDVAIGAQTLREQPRLIQTPQEPGEEAVPALYRFRLAHGLPAQPRHVVYSLRGGLDPALPIFNTPGVEVIVLTSVAGAADLRASGLAARVSDLIEEPLEDPEALRRAHAASSRRAASATSTAQEGRRCSGPCGAPGSSTRCSSPRPMSRWTSHGTPGCSRSSRSSRKAPT